MTARGLVPLVVVCLTLSLQVGRPVRLVGQQQPATLYYDFDPVVVSDDRAEQTVLHARINGSPTRVLFESRLQQPAVDLEAKDDGTSGDRLAGDGIYAVRLDSALITRGLVHNDVFSVFIGYLKPVGAGGVIAQRVNVFAPLVTGEIRRYAISQQASDVQSNPYVVNVHDPGFFVNFDARRVTERFYRFFPDTFDFINIVRVPGYVENRSHFQAQNQVRGIGVSEFNNASRYGSAGRLLGVSLFPNTTFFDGANAGYLHELGHQWINYLTVPPFDGGRPHWPLSSLASGLMGYGANTQGLNFPCELVAEATGTRLVPRQGEPGFTDLDLYLMGIVAPEEVGDHLVFTNQAEAAQLASSCNGQIVTAPVTRVGVRDIVARLGAREPNWLAARKRFSVATIVVSKDGLLSADAMARFAWFAKRASERREVLVHEGFSKMTRKPFFLSVRARAELDPLIAAGAPDFELAVTPQSFTMPPGQAATYAVGILPEFARFDEEVTLACAGLPEEATCSFGEETVVAGETGAQTTAIVSRTGSWPRGTHTFRIVGASPTRTRYATASFTIQ